MSCSAVIIFFQGNRSVTSKNVFFYGKIIPEMSRITMIVVKQCSNVDLAIELFCKFMSMKKSKKCAYVTPLFRHCKKIMLWRRKPRLLGKLFFCISENIGITGSNFINCLCSWIFRLYIFFADLVFDAKLI